MMTDLFALIVKNKELGWGMVVIAILCFLVQYFLRENKKCYAGKEVLITDHKNEITKINDKLLAVITKNTEAQTALSKAIESLERRVN